MHISIIGTGFIGSTLGRKLVASGHQVTFGSRRPDDASLDVDGAQVAGIADALTGADAVILAIPGGGVAEFAQEFGTALVGHLVIDATNNMGAPVANNRDKLPDSLRYARAFSTLGGEIFAEPEFADGPADLFFSSPEQDRSTMEEIVRGVGLRPIYLGADQEAVVDGLFHLWITLAFQQGHGRRLAFRMITA